MSLFLYKIPNYSKVLTSELWMGIGNGLGLGIGLTFAADQSQGVENI